MEDNPKNNKLAHDGIVVINFITNQLSVIWMGLDLKISHPREQIWPSQALIFYISTSRNVFPPLLSSFNSPPSFYPPQSSTSTTTSTSRGFKGRTVKRRKGGRKAPVMAIFHNCRAWEKYILLLLVLYMI